MIMSQDSIRQTLTQNNLGRLYSALHFCSHAVTACGFVIKAFCCSPLSFPASAEPPSRQPIASLCGDLMHGAFEPSIFTCRYLEVLIRTPDSKKESQKL